MKFFRLPAYGVALGLFVCLAPSQSVAHFATDTGEEDEARVEAFRANLLTVDEERVVGRRLAYLYALKHIQVEDAAAQKRLDRIALKLNETVNGETLEIIIIRGDWPEAVSFPPRSVFITSALFELARTDDELTAVIAHEEAHLYSHHLARLVGLALTLPRGQGEQFPTRAAIITGRVSQFAFPQALDGARLGYEMEADQLAARWLARAGYQVNSLATLLENLASRFPLEAKKERAALRARVALLNSQTQTPGLIK